MIHLVQILYLHWPKSAAKVYLRYCIRFRARRHPVHLWGLCLLGLVALALLSSTFGWGDVLRWGLATLVVVLIVSIDLSDSTPVLKSGLHPDRLFEVALDTKKCLVCGIDERVCPRNCFQVDRLRHMETMPGAARCVQCRACIVQCPPDALCFRGPKGEVVLPETIRKFKLNLMSSRATRKAISSNLRTGGCA